MLHPAPPCRFALSTTIALLTFRVGAQAVFNAGDLTPVPGTTYEHISCTGEPFPAAGADLDWYYTGISGTPMGPKQVVLPTGTAGASYFPAATTVHDALLWDLLEYQQSSATDEQYLGYHISPGERSVCSNGRLDILYPLTYGSTFTDSMVCDEYGVYFRVRSGETVTSCVGYGTLHLPSGDYLDCLLLNRTWNYVDDYDGLPPGYVAGESYSIWQAGTPVPLLIVSDWSYTQDGGTIQNYSCYALSDMSTAVPAVSHSEVLRLSPNPTTDLVRLDGPHVQALRVMDATGRTVREERSAPTAHLTIDLGSLPAGLYSVAALTAQGWVTAPLVKQ